MSETSSPPPTIILDEDALRSLVSSLDGPPDDELDLDMATGFVVLLVKSCTKRGRFNLLTEFAVDILDQPKEKYRDLGIFLSMLFTAAPQIKEGVLAEVKVQVPDVLPYIEM